MNGMLKRAYAADQLGDILCPAWRLLTGCQRNFSALHQNFPGVLSATIALHSLCSIVAYCVPPAIHSKKRATGFKCTACSRNCSGLFNGMKKIFAQK